jgi:methylated-DNA-[protein]-cysteine S-methyltransferase
MKSDRAAETTRTHGNPETENCCVVTPTPIGPVTILWSMVGGVPLVTRVVLPGGSFPKGLPEASCPEIDAIRDAIAGMLAGEPVAVPLRAVDRSVCTPFQWEILTALHAVPRGCVTTYRLLAAQVGCPGGARAVGGVMAGNPFPLIVPCHRTIRSDGTLGGFGGGPAMKRTLLAAEGVACDAARVLVPRFHCGDAGRPRGTDHEESRNSRRPGRA